eukprot:1430616-Rhodomonas_salina.1
MADTRRITARACAGLLLASALEAGVRAVVEPEQGEGWRKGRRRSSIAARGRLPSFDGRASRSGSQHSRSSSGHGDAAILAQLQAQCASDTEAAAASEALARAASSASLHATRSGCTACLCSAFLAFLSPPFLSSLLSPSSPFSPFSPFSPLFPSPLSLLSPPSPFTPAPAPLTQLSPPSSRPPSSLAAHALSAHASLSNKDGAHRPLVPLAGEYQRLPPVHRPRI